MKNFTIGLCAAGNIYLNLKENINVNLIKKHTFLTKALSNNRI
jgi:hypothetical protein